MCIAKQSPVRHLVGLGLFNQTFEVVPLCISISTSLLSNVSGFDGHPLFFSHVPESNNLMADRPSVTPIHQPCGP